MKEPTENPRDMAINVLAEADGKRYDVGQAIAIIGLAYALIHIGDQIAAVAASMKKAKP